MEHEQNEADQYSYHNHDSEQWAVYVRAGLTSFIGIGIILSACWAITPDAQFWNVFILGSVTWMIVVTAWVQIYVTRLQWKAMRDQSKHMEGQLGIMKQQTELTAKQLITMAINECAYISFGGWNIPSPIHNNKLVIEGEIYNGGRTPTWNLKSQFQILLAEDFPPMDWEIDWSQCAESPPRMIIANETVPFSPGGIDVTQEHLDQLYATENKLYLFLDGKCSYLDSLGGTQIYEVGYYFNLSDIPSEIRVYERYKKYTREEPKQKPN